MGKIYILLGFLFLFSGCSTSSPVVTKYKISSSIDVPKQKTSTCSSKNVKVSSAFTNSALMSKDMSYVQGDSKVYKYSESAWFNNPNRMVSSELIKMLRELNIYRSVQESRSRTTADLIIESTLEDFMQYYSEDLSSSYALVQINFSLIDAKMNKVIDAKTFRSKVDAKTIDAQGGVKALRSALKNVLQDSSVWFVKGCK